MPARAIFKARVVAGTVKVPVKLYSAVEDRSVHFRLLHAKDDAPVRQAMVNPETDEVVAYDQTGRGFVTEEGAMVRLTSDELDEVSPEPSREIRLERMLPPDALDHRWYDRPYYLGPDGDDGPYAALATALGRSGREGLARWTMRGKRYLGVLRLHRERPMLITVRFEGEVIPVEALEAPRGADLDDKELAMARQLIGMLEGAFDPGAYHDAYRARVLELVEAKRAGGTVEAPPPRRERRPRDLTRALQASLKEARARA